MMRSTQSLLARLRSAFTNRRSTASSGDRQVVVRLRDRRPPLGLQLAGHLAAVLLMAFVFTSRADDSAEPAEPRDRPFTTQADMLIVTVVIYAEATPEIAAVQPVAQGRRSVTAPGAYALALLAADGRTLFELSFQAVLHVPGVPTPLDEVAVVLVIPNDPAAHSLRVTGPTGSNTRLVQEANDG